MRDVASPASLESSSNCDHSTRRRLTPALSQGETRRRSPSRSRTDADSMKPLAVADPLTRQVLATDSARAGAHGAFLQASGGLGDAMARQLAFQMELIERLAGVG